MGATEAIITGAIKAITTRAGTATAVTTIDMATAIATTADTSVSRAVTTSVREVTFTATSLFSTALRTGRLRTSPRISPSV
jgi:hypothetical protein